MTKSTTKNKLKIAFVLDDGFDSIDGVQRNILTLGDWFIKQGHEVRYLVGQTARSDIKNVIPMSKNLKVRYNGNVLSISLFSSKKKILSVLKSEKFDVVHIQMPYSPFMGARVIKYAHKNSVIAGTFHILPYKSIHSIGNYILGAWLRNNLKKIDLKYSVSKPAAEFARKTHAFDSQVLHNPVNLDDFKPINVTRKDSESLSIVFLGRLVPRKGCFELLQAIGLIQQKTMINKNFVLNICGQGHQRKLLEDFVKNNNLEKNVRFHGFVTDEEKAKFLQSADLAVFPAIKGESFGIVLIEAMAAGSGVVLAANNPGYASVMSSMPDVIFDPKNPNQTAETISRFANDSSLSERFHDLQQKFVKEFDVEIIGNKLLSDYRQELSSKLG